MAQVAPSTPPLLAKGGAERDFAGGILHRLDFADAYPVASAEQIGIGVIASFDRSLDRVTTVRRAEPG